MNWLEKLDRKYGNKGIINIATYFIFASFIGDLLLYAASVAVGSGNVNNKALQLLSYMAFSPSSILRGQVWRLVTWIFIPTSGLSFWSILFMVCLLMLGKSLEQGLGTFKMNVYFAMGCLITVVGACLIYLFTGIEIYLTSYYILFSLYLMLGLFYPEAEMRLYFVLPIKMKWLMLVYALMFFWQIYQSFSTGVEYGIETCSTMILAVINLLIFVSSCKNRASFFTQRKQAKRKQNFQHQFRQAAPRPGSGLGVHKCCICGRTSETNPEMMFRYCSKCEGNREYCEEHIFTHTHYRTM